MKKIILLTLTLIITGCSKKDENLFGNKRPVTIIKEHPVVNEGLAPDNTALTSEFQKRLDSKLENQMVRVSEIKIYQNGESYLPLLKMIENSQKYFYMNVLSFTCDETTEKLVKLLETKATSGVQIKLIVNKGFSFLSLSCLSRLKKSGIQIKKTRTHSSYFFNDQQELMIGSQSVARMFFLADGFNSLDRDLMLYSKGPLATDALKDFISIWSEDGSSEPSDLKNYQDQIATEYTSKTRGESVYADKVVAPDSRCRFTTERPALGVKDIQILWKELVNVNKNELYFSGVKVDTGDGELGAAIKKKSLAGVDTHYLGNGYLSGDGELTMVINEWMAGSSLASFMLNRLNLWDMRRLALSNMELYDSLKENAKINVWGYFNFIHYKAWLFENPGFFIGSANLDESKLGVVDDAGVYCLDINNHNELKSYLIRDQKNSELYNGVKK